MSVAPRQPCMLWALCWLMTACTDQPPVSVDYELRGRVVDDLEGHPVKGATVIFTGDTLESHRTTADGDGYYEMEVSLTRGVSFGRVRAEKDGYQPGSASVYFDTPSRTVDLRLRPLEQ